MTSMTEQEELKLLVEQAQELVARMGRGKAEDPEERVERLLDRAASWEETAGYVSLGSLPVDALRQKLEAQASSDDDLEGFNTDWLRYELLERIGSAEWKERLESAVNEMLHAIASRLLKNARQRRRRRNRTKKGEQDVS